MCPRSSHARISLSSVSDTHELGKSLWTGSSEGEMTLSAEQIELLTNCIWGAMMSVAVGLMIWATDDWSEVEPQDDARHKP